MRTAARVIVCFSLMLVLPVLATAQDGKHKAPDTIYAEVAQVDKANWSVTISCFNDEDIVGVAVPLKLSAGMTKLMADSAVYAGGRVESWSHLGFRLDTAIQCVTLGMVASVGPEDVYLGPGKGRLVTLFVSAAEGEELSELTVDTTTTDPGNQLQIIARRDPNAEVTPATFNERLFTPVWVVRKQE